ncbi:uncharacterized protein LOC124911800 [Impatiens glandulifera]|uniref:uncharacterized protein LOC124911800 n=1 Tax=Impatiens glandulifera TaxID=253017 RepID=UPI001FB0BB2C|nr:uncharacterized protein LOC124911800 [Impatiens glandulifera]
MSSETERRLVGGTEYSWCRAVPGGTGITVLGIVLADQSDISHFRNAIHKLQITHPILRAKLHFDPSVNNFSYIIPPNPHFQIQSFDFQSTAEILRTIRDSDTDSSSISSFQLILEYEMNRNDWASSEEETESKPDTDVFFASSYILDGGALAMIIRLHTSACDRAGAAVLQRQLLGLITEEKDYEEELGQDGELGLGIEEYIPAGKANKPFWARGVDMLGYSLNSFRLSNLNFIDADSPRKSRIVWLKLDQDHTSRVLDGCKSRGIELCGALSAAALIAARSMKGLPLGQWEKYMVVTLINCRSILQPVLSNNQLGFYHSAILNTHDISGEEKLWALSKRTYNSFADTKRNNKQFTDMSDLNFLMCRAIENPGLTPSSALRTSFISVFEETVLDRFEKKQGIVELEDYANCASVHGVGPSIAIFDSIKNGCLDCACVYPSPLHSREQMEELIGEMKKILFNLED